MTEGNPFFLAEVVRLLAAEGTLEAPSSATLTIPEGVRDVVGRRLDRLPQEANKALTVGAAIGRDFDADVLAKVMEVDRETLRGAAVECGLSAAAGGGPPRAATGSHTRWVRETLYEELSAAQRPALHPAGSPRRSRTSTRPIRPGSAPPKRGGPPLFGGGGRRGTRRRRSTTRSGLPAARKRAARP